MEMPEEPVQRDADGKSQRRSKYGLNNFTPLHSMWVATFQFVK